MHPHNVLITVTGHDRPGVISALFAALAAHDVEVLDVEQVVMRGRLVLGVALVLHGDPGALRRAATVAAEALGTEIEVTISEDLSERAVPRRSRHHVIVLGHPLRAGAVGEIARRIADLGGNLETIQRLGEDRAIGLELMVTGADHDALAATLVTVALETGTDIAMERAGLRRRAKRLVLLDADRTLLPTDTIGQLAELAGYGDESARLLEAARHAELVPGADDIVQIARRGADEAWTRGHGAGQDGRDGARRDGAGRDTRDGAGRDGLGRDGAGRDGLGRDGAGRDGLGRDGRGGSGRDGSGRDGSGRDGSGRNGGRGGAGREGDEAEEWGRTRPVARRRGGQWVRAETSGHAGAAATALVAGAVATGSSRREAELLRARVALLEGLPVTAVAKVQAATRWSPGAGGLVAALRKMGYRCGAVSGGAAQVVEPLLDELGLDFAVANRLEVAGKHLTGRLVDAGLDPASKVQALLRFADAYGVPLSQTVAVGGLGGIDMLAIAGLGVAIGSSSAQPPAPRRVAADRAAEANYAESLLVVLGLPAEDLPELNRAPLPAADRR